MNTASIPPGWGFRPYCAPALDCGRMAVKDCTAPYWRSSCRQDTPSLPAWGHLFWGTGESQ